MLLPKLTFFGLARDFKPLRSVITVLDNTEVVIDNCIRLGECNDIRCSAESGGYVISVWGTGLSASNYANGSAQICGEICSVSIERKCRGRSCEK